MANVVESVFRNRGARAEPWILAALAVLVGVASSAVAVVLRGGVHLLSDRLDPWRTSPSGVLLPAAGALLGILVVRRVFREPGGHGVPAVLEAVSRRGGAMRARSVFSRLFGSMLNVASGGSAGLEGPTVYSAAAVGSVLGDWFRVGDRQRTLLLACGVAGGIGAIFDAPLTGMIFSIEVVLAEWTLGAALPIAISATVATEIGRLVFGESGAFAAPPIHDWSPADLAASAGLGGLAGLLSVALVAAIFRMEHLCRAAGRRIRALRLTGACAAVAGLGVGLVGLYVPEAIGEGYETVSAIFRGEIGGGLVLLGVLVGAKFLATTLTLGSNAPGGIFAPSLVVGALLGAAYGEVLHAVFPSSGFAPPAFFALVAMAGLVAGTMHAPLTGILLALETTRGWHGVLPIILVAVCAVLVSRTFLRHSFYTWELAERGALLRPRTDRRILADLAAAELLDQDSVDIEVGRTLEDLTRVLPRTTRNHFAVVDRDGRYLGMLDLTQLRGVIFDDLVRRVTPVETVMDPTAPPIRADEPLLQVMDAFESSGRWVLPVVDAEGRFLGTLSKSTLFDRYRRELIAQTEEE